MLKVNSTRRKSRYYQWKCLIMQLICKRIFVLNYDTFCGAGVNCILDIKQPEEKIMSSDAQGSPYSSNNVIVDNAIVLYISCSTGDRLSNMLDRACIRKLGFLFLTVREFLDFLFRYFFQGVPGFILKQRRVDFLTAQECEFRIVHKNIDNILSYDVTWYVN